MPIHTKRTSEFDEFAAKIRSMDKGVANSAKMTITLPDGRKRLIPEYGETQIVTHAGRITLIRTIEIEKM